MSDQSQTSYTADELQNQRGQEGLIPMVHGLNALRVVATFLVLVAHASIPYMRSPTRTTLWLVHDSAHHVAVDALLFWVNGFAMPLFFLMAGISAAQACANTPFTEFVWHRFRRLSSPFLLATVIILPVALFAWGVGLLLTERVSLSQILRLKFSPELQPHMIGPFHLWFLEYLFLISVGWCAIVQVTAWLLRGRNEMAKAAIAKLFASSWRPVLFAIPTTAVFLCDVETPFRLPNTFIPDVMRVIHYTLFFMAGAWIARLPQPLTLLKQHWRIYFLAASVVFCWLLPLSLRLMSSTLAPWELPLQAVSQAVFAWLMVFGSLGFFLTWFGKRSKVFRFLNEASLWVYLIHLPLVAIAQLLVWPVNCGVPSKIFLVTLLAIVGSLVSYQYCVRYSVLGAIISGGRKRLAGVQGWRLEAGWLGTAAAMVVLLGLFLYVNRAVYSGHNQHVVMEGKIYRGNRLTKAEDLEATIEKYGLKAIISAAPVLPDDPWWQEQQRVCTAHGVVITAVDFCDREVPQARQLHEMNAALDSVPRPVFIEGDKRTPTLCGIGSAIALLLDDVHPDEALQQFSWRYAQLEGPEHCIIAKPLLAYRNWLREHDLPHTGETYRRWTRTEKVDLDKLAKEKKEPAWISLIGAPRYPRWR